MNLNKAAADDEIVDRILSRVERNLDSALDRVLTWLTIDSVSSDPSRAPRCRDAARWIADRFAELSMQVAIEETAGHPIVLAKGGTELPSLLFYGHYDVQSARPESSWEHPPFEPRIRTLSDGRKVISGRGASDDKGQVMTFVEACRAWHEETGELPCALTVLIEGEEEVGSTNLRNYVLANRTKLAGELLAICDTSLWDAGYPAVITSLRGVMHFEVVVRTAVQNLHSGIYGGAAANAIQIACQIIASLKDANGRIAIPEFYDGVREPTIEERQKWAALDLTSEDFLAPVGLHHSIGECDRTLVEQIQSRPAVDVNGFEAGYTGPGTMTIIPASARFKISFRTVSGQDCENIAAQFEQFVRRLLPNDCSADVTLLRASPASSFRHTPKLRRAVDSALRTEWGRSAAFIGSGGSISVVPTFQEALGVDPLLIGFASDDDAVHAPNEKYDVESFRRGTRSWVRLLGAFKQLDRVR
jgi:acetylornithine deacetylase/succinyl-diaminopimelate desuccinylase-like protein